MAEIQQEHDFFTWSIQNFVRKMKKKKKKKKVFENIILLYLAKKLYETDKFLISFYAICY